MQVKKIWAIVQQLHSENTPSLRQIIPIVPFFLTVIAWISPAICYFLLHSKMGGKLQLWKDSIVFGRSGLSVSDLDPMFYFSVMVGVITGIISSGYALKALYFCKRNHLDVWHENFSKFFSIFFICLGMLGISSVVFLYLEIKGVIST